MNFIKSITISIHNIKLHGGFKMMVNVFRRSIVTILSAIIILSLFACSVNTNNKTVVTETSAAATADSYNATAPRNASAKKQASNDMGMVEEALSYVTGTGNSGASNDKKIVKTVDIYAETKTFEESLKLFRQYVEKYNGTIDNSYVDTGTTGYAYAKNAYFAIRVPADKLDSFLNTVGENLNVTYKNENTRDVTEEYDDTEARIKTLKIEEEKLNELMTKAKNVEDMILIEDKLSEIRSELESITRKMKKLDRDVAYSTVNVYITEVKDLTEVKEEPDDYSFEGIMKLIKKNYEDTKAFLIKEGVAIITHLPAIIAALIGLLIVLIIAAIYRAIVGAIRGDKKEEGNEKNKEEDNGENKEKDADDVEVEFYEEK